MRLKIAREHGRYAVSVWRGTVLVAGIGFMRLPGRRRFHFFADWRGQSWAYFSGIGWM